MSQFDWLVGPAVPSTGRRRAVRYLAALAAGVVAVLYFLIGFGQLRVLDSVEDGTPSLIFFGIPAGMAFVLGAVLLLATDRRPLWMLGTAFQLFAIVMYFEVAPGRTPPFETWGVLIKLLQLGIVAALSYLALPSPGGLYTAHRPDDRRRI